MLEEKRGRIAAGFIQLKKVRKDVSMPFSQQLKIVWEKIKDNLLSLHKAIASIFLEVLANFFAYVDINLRKEIPFNWKHKRNEE